ncbi:intersectin-1-like isoform X2 [Bolinopsis microptera]|uniref:intersectin-1-like isoform X2 n=1 Tax=Bolinopsis microptera TaxID=2820187 RepID=UPI0030798E4F
MRNRRNPTLDEIKKSDSINMTASNTEEINRRKSAACDSGLPASCMKLTELLVGVKDSDALSSLICAMGHVLLEVYSEVKSVNHKKSNRDSVVNKLLYERRISNEQSESKIPEEPIPPNSPKITTTKDRMRALIKRPVSRTPLDRDSSFEYLSARDSVTKDIVINPPKPDEPRSRSKGARRGSIETTLEHLADCKSIIDTILDTDKKDPTKEEGMFSDSDVFSDRDIKPPAEKHPKNTLQVPKDILSSDSETPKPQQSLSRQSSFKRQKSFRKKKTRSRNLSSASASDMESSTESKVPRKQLSMRSKTSTYLDVTSKSKLNLQVRDRKSSLGFSDNGASSDERARSVFSSDGESYASDSSRKSRIKDRFTMNRNRIPTHFSDIESDVIIEPVKPVLVPEPVVEHPKTAERSIKIVRSGTQCYVAPNNPPVTPTRSGGKSNKRTPKVPKRHHNRILDTTSLSVPVSKQTSAQKRLSTPPDGEKLKPGGLKRYSENKNKNLDNSRNPQQRMLTSALKSVLAFAQITNDKILFEVETLVDYIGATVDELSFSKGIRISVYEVRGSYYYGELAGRTGLVALNHVEKCEWIYGDVNIDKEVIAMYDYHSDVEGDLSFSAGDVVKVTEELGEWFRGNIGEKTGIFPGNYIQILDEEIKEVSGSAPPPSSALPTVDPKPLCTGVMVAGYVTEDVELDQGELVSILAQPDLLNVYIEDSGGRRTWIKTELLRINQDLEAPSNGPIGADRIPASLHCYSLYPYSAQNNDELSLKRDDIITITEQSDPHWWIGRLGAEVGVLPANYVQQINDQDAWETVKAWNANLSAAEDERTRQEAIHELISTEKTYIDDLLLVVEVFYNPLCSVATDDELTSVFVNWQQLILCNARLFRALYNNSDINSFESVGSVFLEEIDSLIGPYTKFCSAQRQAMITLQEGVSHDFKVKEKECAGSPKVGKLPLSTFLLKPMQRITKYPLLIKKILQHTRDTHPDYQSLKDSLTRTEHLLTSVNEAVRATTRLESLQRVFDKCCDDLGEKVRLNSNTNCLGARKLIHFGSVFKNKGSKELFAILFTDTLWITRVDKGRYGNKPIDIDARDFDSIKFETYRDPFLLNNVFPTESNKNSADLAFSFSYNDRNYSFTCQTAKEASDWVDHLNDGIRNATLLYHSHYKTSLPDPTIAGQATITLRIVEGLELALPPDEKPNSLFVQASLLSHVQKTPTGAPKWDHTIHFVVGDVSTDKINITVFKENSFSPNVSLGKFDLSIQKLLKTGGPGPWNKRLILTDTNSGMVNVCIMLRYHGNR